MAKASKTAAPEDFGDWLARKPAWLQRAVTLLDRTGEVSEEELQGLLTLQRSGEALAEPGGPRHSMTSGTSESARVTIDAVKRVEGIEALAPTRPLTFSKGLTVVFGHNGTGKSAYVRLLSGAAGLRTAPLRADVFAEAPERREAIIAISANGTARDVTWSPGDPPIREIANLLVFDQETQRLYLSRQHRTRIAPRDIVLLRALVGVCRRAADAIRLEGAEDVPIISAVPHEHAGTPIDSLILELGPETTPAELEIACRWSGEDDARLRDLQAVAAGGDPQSLLNRGQASLAQLDDLVAAIDGARRMLRTEALHRLGIARECLERRERAAIEAADALSQGDAKLVAESSWRALWQAAVAFAREAGGAFENSRLSSLPNCVLCNQELKANAKARLIAFEEAVVKHASRKAEEGRARLSRRLSRMPTRLSEDDLRAKCLAAAMPVEEWMEPLNQAFAQVEAITSAVASSAVDAKSMPRTELDSISESLRSLRVQRAAEIEGLRGVIDGGSSALGELRTLLARRWASQNRIGLESEVARRKRVADRDARIAGWAHGEISNYSGRLAEHQITSEYITRFEGELKALGARRTRVGLSRSGTVEGQPTHEIAFVDARDRTARPGDILSEGEARVVALALCLADLGSMEGSPFIFDDPITSLDNAFEQRVANRLIALAEDRQVIVFTHRLTLCSYLLDKSQQVQFIDAYGAGVGNPGPPELVESGHYSALTEILKNELQEADSAFNKGDSAWKTSRNAVLKRLRPIVEGLVPTVLLDDVVLRFKGEVRTKDKLHHLLAIRRDDCAKIDAWMTKYSFPIHSQGDELAWPEPSLAEIRSDIQEMAEWITGFKKRKGEQAKI